MKTLVIGHRGSGKSLFAKRCETYLKEAGRETKVFDLDEVIAKTAGQSVSEIFSTQGEKGFRKLEKDAFERILNLSTADSGDVIVVAGAGFEGDLPSSWHGLWIRRITDAHGRIFTDRPRLNPDLTPLEEFQFRYFEREPRYRQLANEILTIPEGFAFPNEAERAFVLDEVRNAGGAITLVADDFKGLDRTKLWLEKRLRMGIKYFELRDDLLSSAQMTLAFGILPADRVLLSYRNKERLADTKKLQTTYKPQVLDWGVELGPLPEELLAAKKEGARVVISIHKRKPGPLLDTVRVSEKLEAEGFLVKLAVPVENFKELAEGESWRAASPEMRAFLPSSPDGRWAWYRLWLKDRSPLNFLRESDGTSPDQPLLLDWIRRSNVNEEFAAVVGDPVAHSRTPGEQAEFFSESDFSVFPIRVTEDEFDQGAMTTLVSLGMRFAAVTAPLKTRALGICKRLTPEATRMRAVNSLLWEGEWVGTNTDYGGFRAALKGASSDAGVDIASCAAVLWGGGGMVAVVQSALPAVLPVSARTRLPRDNTKKIPPDWSPEVVVWAVSRQRWREGGLRWPPENWKPRVIFDLNYAEDSPGREFALKCGAKYVSGLGLFRNQAELQRKFWRPDVS